MRFNYILVRSSVSDVSVDVPDELDISQLRGKGLQPGEEELPPSNATEPQGMLLNDNYYEESYLFSIHNQNFCKNRVPKTLHLNYFTTLQVSARKKYLKRILITLRHCK